MWYEVCTAVCFRVARSVLDRPTSVWVLGEGDLKWFDGSIKSRYGVVFLDLIRRLCLEYVFLTELTCSFDDK